MNSESNKGVNAVQESSIVVSDTRENLISLRKSAGKTQREVAADLDISETYLRMLEKGTSNPGVELLFKVAKYFVSDVYQCWPDLAGERPENVPLDYN